MNDDLKKIIAASHASPHDFLGPHQHAEQGGKQLIVRTFIPYAVEVCIRIKQQGNKSIKMNKIHADGLFATQIPKTNGKSLDYLYQVTDAEGQTFTIQDAYRFQAKLFTDDDEIRFLNGEHHELATRLGAHACKRQGCDGVGFVIWAPHAQRVSVVGSFNRWDGRVHPMRKIEQCGIWELFIPAVKNGDLYKFEIKSASGDVFLKSDPFAFQAEKSPEAAGIVYVPKLTQRKKNSKGRQQTQPLSTAAMAIYQVDGTSGMAMTGLDLAVLKEQGYSHLEIPGLFQVDNEVASYFAPNPHIATLQQLQDFVERCHVQALGVIIDGISVRGKIAHGKLAYFDGAPLYEKPAPQAQGEYCFDIGNPGVRSFFLSHACYWLEKVHIDGFHADSEACLLYRQLTQELVPQYAGTLLLASAPFMAMQLPPVELERLFHGHIDNPFTVLGPQRQSDGNAAVIRMILPRAEQAYIDFPKHKGICFSMQRQSCEGLWQAHIPQDFFGVAYLVQVVDTDGTRTIIRDPYSVKFTHINQEDKALYAAGNHYRIHEKLGAHLCRYDGQEGVVFAVWAPNADAVSVVGPFNHWEASCYPMRLYAGSGIWELFIPGLANGELYKFAIRSSQGVNLLKSDPYAFLMETAPDTASIVYAIPNAYRWSDQQWLQKRSRNNPWNNPLSIYEVHLASWMKGPENRHLDYAAVAKRIIPYVKEMGFTHIEILPIAEHPYEPSWGYQVANFYAPTSRLGKPEQLMAFIDQCHHNNIGVILDWVAGHFPKDAYALAQFDGTYLYEHADPRQGEHMDWGTLIFNYGRHEVENFLIANALFWLERYHFDGLRVDAVASMLYLDYSRKHGEWIPNVHGGNENLEAIEFLKHSNAIVHAKFPGVLMIAEESTAWPGVSRPTDQGGLGFGFKWNMGWMHDVLSYMQTPAEQRCRHHDQLVFVFHYAFDENFVLSLSHDEVVHLKGSLYTKMPGDVWEKLANLRLLFAFMFAHPGKKLNFMGAEFAQIEEWSESRQLQWQLLEKPAHLQLQRFMQALNKLYRMQAALYEMDCRPGGFAWIDAGNHEQSIIAFMRKAREPRNALLIIINFSAISRFDYRVGVPYPVAYHLLLNSNERQFGGGDKADHGSIFDIDEIPWHGQEFSLKLKLPALCAIVLQPAVPDYTLATV